MEIHQTDVSGNQRKHPLLKILMVDKYYFIKGGAERYMFELSALLERHGHTVVPFAMRHPENAEAATEPYFVSQVDYDDTVSFRNRIRQAVRIFYSREARRSVEALILKYRPDIAHLHMIDHQISPSILHAFRKHRIPVIQTVHQYKLICPNYRLYNPGTGQICEKCLKGCPFYPIKTRCHRESRNAGLAIALEAWLHRSIGIYKTVGVFHSPSHFMKRKLVEGGIPGNRIHHLFYTLDLDAFHYEPDHDDYFVFVGRLSHEKGLVTLLKAMAGIQNGNLKIVGDGPLRPTLEEFAADFKLKHVSFLGNQPKQAVQELVSRAQFLVCPSEWYENSPLVIYEALAVGTPVIGAAIGGIPELILSGETGDLFPPGDVMALRRCIQGFLDNPMKIRVMARNARAHAEALFHPDLHYRQIMRVYRHLIEKTNPPEDD
ncbi:MAG TPA: glycosyltransferase family 1 protein [bacterium]|nr:glycosyltransferase family 1 protein [bacterium]